MERTEIIALFRVSRGEVNAILTVPGERTFNSRGFATCYAHNGQHSECSYGWYEETRKASPEEYAPLLHELGAIGYDVQIGHKVRS